MSTSLHVISQPLSKLGTALDLRLYSVPFPTYSEILAESANFPTAVYLTARRGVPFKIL